MNPITRLFQSSKALVVMAVTVACFAAHLTGKASWHEVTEFLKWIITAWLGSVAAEDAAKHLAGRAANKTSQEVIVSQAPSKSDSLPSVSIDVDE